MARITRKKLDEIINRCETATPGPWKVFGRDKHIIGNDIEDATNFSVRHCQWTHNTTEENAEFIAKARTDVPDLVAEIRELWHEISQLRNNK